jgi:hypothetical protein
MCCLGEHPTQPLYANYAHTILEIEMLAASLPLNRSKPAANILDNMKQPATILVLPVLYTILVIPEYHTRIFQYLQYWYRYW